MSKPNRIAEYRKKLGISQTALCDAVGDGWGQSRLSMYELGHNEPSLPDCRKIVSGLNLLGAACTLDDVFPPKEPEQPASPTTNEAA